MTLVGTALFSIFSRMSFRDTSTLVNFVLSGEKSQSNSQRQIL